MTGGTTDPHSGPGAAWRRFPRHHAFIIGIDAYQRVSPLRTAVNDARRLAELLAGQHQFEVHAPLLDATGAQMRELLDNTLKKQVRPHDRVLFYFAGHGIAADGDDGPAGYLVPADADARDPGTLIAMADLQRALDALPCHHLMLILDCCFSGAFKWSSQHRAINGLMPKRLYAQRFSRFIEDRARQILTSAAHDQKALDVLQGKATGDRGAATTDDGMLHSPFALALFDALAGEADVRQGSEGDGVITATEIYAYIRDRIEPATLQHGARMRQTPSFFPLKGHDKGEFMFLHPRHRLNLPPMEGKSPYKGLSSFDEDDRHLFYGRDRVVADLASKAADPAQRLIVVTGPSGTGKSSVIKAGLLPQLRQAGLAVLLMRPGEHPLKALDACLGAGSDPAVLIVDQFEELITRCADPAERAAFDARLHALLQDGGRVSRLVITVRSDFEPQLNGGALKAAWLTGRFTVPPFSLDELREVIVMPTVQQVMIFDPPELVDQILGEVVQSPGALPLLSYTLNELFEAYMRSGRNDRALKQSDYEQLGGVMGALRTKADKLYASLVSDAERDMLRRVMLRMVSVEGDLAGRRVPLVDLDFGPDGKAAVATVVEQLIAARLVVMDHDAIEPAHDALVRAWKLLRDWIHDAGRDKLILGEQLQAAAADHALSGNVEFLWHSSPNLPAVQALLQDRRRCWFNARERRFIKVSVRRKTLRARVGLGIAATVFVSLTALMAWGWIEQRRATNTIAEARVFTDDLLVNLMRKLREIEHTQEVRKDLVTQVAHLHRRLVEVGATEDHNTRFWTTVLEGDFDVESGRFDGAREKYKRALDVAEPRKASAHWQRNLSIGQGQLGDLALRVDKAQGKVADFEAARHHYERALELDRKLVDLDADTSVARHDLFVSHYRLGNLARRMAQYELGQNDRADVRHLHLTAREHYTQARCLATRLLHERLEAPAEARRDLTRTRIELGHVAFDLAGDAKDEEGQRAAALYDEALRAAREWRVDVEEHDSMRSDLGKAWGRMALLHILSDRLDDARRANTEASAAIGRPPPAAPKPAAIPEAELQHDVFANRKTLGVIEERARKPRAARKAYLGALQIAEKELRNPQAVGDWRSRHFDMLLRLAEIETQARDIQSARRAFQRAAKFAPGTDERKLAASCATSPRSPCKPR